MFDRIPTRFDIEALADDLLFSEGYEPSEAAEIIAAHTGGSPDDTLEIVAEYRARVLDAEQCIPQRSRFLGESTTVTVDLPF